MSSNTIQRLVAVFIFSTIAAQLTHAQEAFPWRIQADSLVTDTLGAGTSFEKIDAPDTLHAMAVSTYGGMISIFRTADGGTTWKQSLRHWARETSMNDISHPTPQCAVVVGDTMYQYVDTGSTIFYTHDGGDTWQQGWCDSCKVGNGFYRSPLRCVSMCDSLNGILTGWAFLIARTTDGGRTWHRIPDPTKGQGNYYGVQCLNPSTYLIRTGGIYRTDDSGRTWTYKRLAEGTSFYDFIDPLHGWAVGSRPEDSTFRHIVTRTTDGGTTWDTLYNARSLSRRDFRLSCIAMADATHGVAAGDGGIWLYTADGTHWQEGPNLYSMSDFKISYVNDLTYPHPNKAWGLAPVGKILVYEPKTASVARAGSTSAATTIAVFPNPVPRSTPTTITLEIHERTSSVRLFITNTLGEEVNMVEMSGALDTGEHRITYTAPPVSGYYFVRLTSNGRTIALSPIIVQ